MIEWIVLFMFCAIVLVRAIRNYPQLKTPKIFNRLNALWVVVRSFLLFFPLGPILILTTPIWIIVWLLTGFNIERKYMNLLDKYLF